MSPQRDWNQMRDRIIGLGEESSRKSFYPELQQQLNHLDQARENLRTLFNAIPDAIFITDLEGRILDVNDAMLVLFGVTRETFRDFTADAYTASSETCEEAASRRGAMLEQLKREGSLILEWTARRPADGSTFEVEGSLRIGRWYDAEVIVSVVRDITGRKRLEAMLRQSQKLDALGQLAGGVAHDTNNMLGVIIGYTSLLEERLADDRLALDDLGQITKAALRSSDLIRQLLAFARKQTIQPQLVDLNQLVEATQRMLRRLIGENIALLWKPATTLWPVWLDPSQIDQILANLVVNARDAIHGTGSIVLATGKLTVDDVYAHSNPDAVPGDYVTLTVSDTGHGMTPEVQARIFDPFFTTKEAGRGTGLGLATVYGTLRQNGGFITVSSVPGEGSTFCLAFPRHDGESGESAAPEAEAAVPRGHETLLLVEDELPLLSLEKTLLEGAGYRVLATASPRQAQHIVTHEPGIIHLLVTDLVLPEMNGWDLHQWVREHLPGLPSLFMSGYPTDVLQHMQTLEPDCAFLQKPFLRGELLRKVRQLLDRRK